MLVFLAPPPGDHSDAAGLVDVAGHDADLALQGGVEGEEDDGDDEDH